MNGKLYRSALYVTTALSLGLIAPAFAANDTGTEEIVVTARRVEERLQDVPISIKVFNQAQLDQHNVVNSGDLAKYTPSLSANNNFGSENTTFAIRGFVQENGTAPSVGTYFADVVSPRGPSNGLPTGDGLLPGSFFDLQNVQVLKGPQGTLQGRNTTGGAVLLVPQKPSSEFGGYIQGSFGNYNMRGIQGVVNVPVNDKIRVRLGVDHQSRDGYAINTTGIGPRDFNDVNYLALRGSVVVDITPDLENYTIISYTKSDTNGGVQKLVAAGGGQLAELGQAQLDANKGEGFYDLQQNLLTKPYSKVDQLQFINTTTWHATDRLTFKNIASYAEFTDKLNTQIFGTAFKLGDSSALAALLSPAGLAATVGFAQATPLPGHSTADESTITEEFQVQGRTSNDVLVYQGGAYFEFARPLDLVGSQSPVFLHCTNSDALQCEDFINEAIGSPAGAVNITAGKTSYRDIGLYAQSTLKLTEQLKLTGGFRWTWDRERVDAYQQTVHFIGTPATTPTFVCTFPDHASLPDCHQHISIHSNAPTWLIDLDYAPTQDYLFYAKYSRGYRTGVISPNIVGDLEITKPEKVDTYEVGAKTSFHGRLRGSFNVSAFYNDFSNQQLQFGFNAASTNVASTAAPVNVGRSRLFGLEVDTVVRPFAGFTLEASYTYLNTKILRIRDFTGVNVPNYNLAQPAQVGDELALSPNNKFSLTATYVLPLNESVGTVALSGTFTHTDSQVSNYTDRGAFAVANPEFLGLDRLQPRDLLDLNLVWSSVFGRPVDVMLFATNVTGEEYYGFIPGLGGVGGAELETAVLGEPTMFGGRLKLHFGG